MKTLMLALVTAAAAQAAGVADHLGLQLYSLRVTAMQQGWRAELDQTKAFGLGYVEGGAPPKGLTEAQYTSELASRGLTMVSAGFGYEGLAKDVSAAVAQARALGVKFVMCAWIPHTGDMFTDADARKAAADFNAWGAAFKAAGITFTYHAHGYEFRPDGNGDTPFDVLARATNPGSVSFEMDVFWVTHGGQDPVRLMAKYPERWALMHVKDIRRGAPTGIFTGHAPATDDVAVGTGQVDWPAVFREARAVGVSYYFIEDESVTPLVNVPLSIAYVRSLGM